jgi:hypothetical protein
VIEKEEDEILARDSDITHPLLAERLSSDSSSVPRKSFKTRKSAHLLCLLIVIKL